MSIGKKHESKMKNLNRLQNTIFEISIIKKIYLKEKRIWETIYHYNLIHLHIHVKSNVFVYEFTCSKMSAM